MASLKAIRRRIASVKSTQQITKAMKLVAASRLRRAQEALVGARPYSEALTRVADSLLQGSSIGPSEGAKKAVLMVAIASDRGLCGGYNSNILRFADDNRRRLSSHGFEVQLYAVGKKAVEHWRRARVTLADQSVENLPRLATVGLARKIAARMLSDYQSGAVQEVVIVYTRFRSALTMFPTLERVLPVEQGEGSSGQASNQQQGAAASGEDLQTTEYLVEPSREQLVPVVLRSYVEAAVLHALLEAEASDQGARMTAMDNATNNANEMVSALTLEMNRARQAQITRELMDIVGGAEALRGQS